jgi:hypothetical protein
MKKISNVLVVVMMLALVLVAKKATAAIAPLNIEDPQPIIIFDDGNVRYSGVNPENPYTTQVTYSPADPQPVEPVVPEPVTMSLLSAGLLGMIGLKRRMKS